MFLATNGIVFSLYLNIGPGIDNVRMACPAYVSVAAFFAELILLLISESGFVYCIYVSHHFLKGARDALHLRFLFCSKKKKNRKNKIFLLFFFAIFH